MDTHCCCQGTKKKKDAFLVTNIAVVKVKEGKNNGQLIVILIFILLHNTQKGYITQSSTMVIMNILTLYVVKGY